MLSFGMIYKIGVLITFLIIVCNTGNYTLVKLSMEREGACLDGSPPGLYYHQGSGKNKDKFMLYFDSGGFCGDATLASTLQACYKRSFGSLGSTKNYLPSKNFQGQGLLSTTIQQNPVFYDWTKLFMIYCDGSEYQGYKKDPVQYKDRNLYFRGAMNVKEQFRFMSQRFDFYNKDTIVITGVSAGGIASYMWSNYLVENTKTSKVYSIPDSGLFITDYYSPVQHQKLIRTRAENLFKLIDLNTSFSMPQCLQQFKGDSVSCFNAANLAKYLKSSMFIIESAYDAWSVQNAIGADCLVNKMPPYSISSCNETVQKAIIQYRQLSLQGIKALQNNRKDVGVWSPACVQHGFSDSPCFNNQKYKVPSGNGILLYEAIAQFLQNPLQAKSYIDTVEWPLNKGCNGLSNRFIRNIIEQ